MKCPTNNYNVHTNLSYPPRVHAQSCQGYSFPLFSNQKGMRLITGNHKVGHREPILGSTQNKHGPTSLIPGRQHKENRKGSGMFPVRVESAYYGGKP